MNQTEVVSLRYFSSVRTNGEGWFRMHPPMHALYHLPNLVSHPTPQPISKPTPWRTYASKQAAFGQQRARAAGLFVPALSQDRLWAGVHASHPSCTPNPKVCTARHMCTPHHLHHAACHMGVVIAMKSTVVVKSALFELHVHAILHSYMLMTCGLLHAIHAHAHA
mgnify:CR=1 FL=1